MNDLPEATDIAILGGGFAGIATAWALTQRGVRALVLEREPALGRYASGRSAGLGRQLAEDDVTSALTIRGAAILRDRLPAVWQPCGGILSFDQAAEAEVYAARAARFGVAVERLDRAATIARWPGAAALPIAAAIYVPSDGVIDVGGLLSALARDAREATIACEAGVTHLEPLGAPDAGVRLITPRGALRARVVVDAAGAWAGALTGAPPLASFKRHIYVLEAASPAGAPFLWHLGAGELYVRHAADGLLVSPCDAAATEPADQQPDERGRAALSERFAATGWSTAPIARQWACQRAFTPDRTMRLGRDPDRPWLVWAAGLGGHGATAAAAVGEVVAEACLSALA